MWSVVFTVALLCGASLGNPLKFEIPREFRAESPLDSYVPEYRSPIFTPARPLVEMLETPETRAGLVEEIERLFEQTRLPCTSNLRTTMFVALLHLEGNLAAVETGLFKERAVKPILEELDTITRTKVVDAIRMVAKELLEKPIMEGLGSAIKRNEHMEAIVVVLRRLEAVIRSREMFTFKDLELVLRPLFISLSKVQDCSLLISRQQVLDVCQTIIARMTKPGLLETSLKTLEYTLTSTIRDTTKAAYMRDVLETLTTKYVSLMTYTMTSLTTLLRSEVRPTALLVDWMYCLTMMPTARIEASKYTTIPVARTFQEFPATLYPDTPFLASTIVPPVSPLAHLIIVVYQKPYPVHESSVPIQRLKESVWSEVRELSLPKPTESCYPQRMAAYNSVLVVLLNTVDRMMLNTTCSELFKALVHSDALPHYMEKSQKQALWQEIMRLKTELLLPQMVAVETILEVPELLTILESSTLLELINFPRDITFPTLISAIKTTLNLVKTSPSLCNVEVHRINRRIGHVLTTVGSSLAWESVELKLTEGLLNFCEMHKMTIFKPSLYKTINIIRPVFEMRTNHKLSLLDDLLTCFVEERIIPDVLANILITMKIKIAHLEKVIPLPTSALHRGVVLTRINIAFTKIPMQKRYPVYDVNVPKISTMESLKYFPEGKVDLPEIRMLSFPSESAPCFMPKIAAFNILLVELLHGADSKAMESTLAEILTSSEFSLARINPEILRSIISTLTSEVLIPEKNVIKTHFEIPELRDILKTSEVLKVIKFHDITFRDIMAAINADLHLITESRSLCTMDVTRIERLLEAVFTTMKTSFSVERIEPRLFNILRTNFNSIISESLIYEIVNRITPVFEIANRRRASLINEIRTDISFELIPTDVLANIILCFKRISEIRITSRDEVSGYYPGTPVDSYKTLLSEVAAFSVPRPTEPCYSQKVAAVHAVLVELMHGLKSTIIETALNHFMELPSVKHLLSSRMDTVHPKTIALIFKREMSSEIVAIKALSEVPEVHRLLEKSELVNLVKSRVELTFPAVLVAIKDDLEIIRRSDYLCTADVPIVLLNAEHYLTSLRTLFSWETIQHKLITGLRRTFEKVGIVHDISDYKLIVNELRPVFEQLTIPYTSTVEKLMADVRHEDISTDALYHILVALHELVRPTAEIIPMAEPFNIRY